MKAMKTKMLIFVFLLGITDLFAQTLYVPGTIVKGKNASYYCSTKYEILIKVNNVNNVDTTTTMYYDDGTALPSYKGLGGTIATKNEDLVRVFQGALTQEEREMLKGKIGYLLILNIVTDKQGNAHIGLSAVTTGYYQTTMDQGAFMDKIVKRRKGPS